MPQFNQSMLPFGPVVALVLAVAPVGPQEEEDTWMMSPVFWALLLCVGAGDAFGGAGEWVLAALLPEELEELVAL